MAIKVFLILLIGIINTTFAHHTISIKFIDQQTNNPICLTEIIINDTTLITDSTGIIHLKQNTNWNEISVKATYYESKTFQIPFNHSDPIFIYLNPIDITTLKEVVIENENFNSHSNLVKVDLNMRNFNTSQDLLRIIPGLFIAQHAGGGKAEQLFLRGFDIDHGTDININVDGIPVNMVSHAHGQGYADMHFVIPELVQNIEYGKGPYFSDVGNLGTAGFAKFKTFNVLEKSKVSIETGNFNTIRNVNLIDLLNNNKKGLANSAYVGSEIFTSNGPFISNQNFKRVNLFSKYTLQTDNSTLTISGLYFSSNWDASGQIPTRAVTSKSISRWGSIDDSEGGATGRKNLHINYLYKPNPKAILENSFYVCQYNFKLYSNFTFFLRDSINGDQIKQAENRKLIGYNGSYSQSKSLGKTFFKQQYGLQIRYDEIDNSELSYTKKRKFLNFAQLGNISEMNQSIYTNYQLSCLRFSINVGFRFERMAWEYTNLLDTLYSRKTTQKYLLLPKLNFQYKLRNNIQLYFKAGKGFHSNDARIIINQNSKGLTPCVYGSDLGLNIKINTKTWLNSALWMLYSQQEFVYVGDEGIVEPSGSSFRKGIDLSLRTQVAKYLMVDLDLTYNYAKTLNVPNKESYIPLAPKFTASGGMEFRFKKGINGNIRFRHLANRPANETNSVIAKGYTLIDASIYYTHKKYEVGFIFQNILNTFWNEAQFLTTSKLKNETHPVTEINYTPGTPFFGKLKVSYFF